MFSHDLAICYDVILNTCCFTNTIIFPVVLDVSIVNGGLVVHERAADNADVTIGHKNRPGNSNGYV